MELHLLVCVPSVTHPLGWGEVPFSPCLFMFYFYIYILRNSLYLMEMVFVFVTFHIFSSSL